MKRIRNETALLPTFTTDKIPFFRSNRVFFFTTIPNVNYGMDRAALENFANSKRPAPEYHPEDEIKLSGTNPIAQKTAQKNHPENEKTAQNIIDILVSNPHCTRAELSTTLSKSDGTIKKHLAILQGRGIIQRVVSDKGGYWKVLIRK